LSIHKASDGKEFFDPRRAHIYERSLTAEKSRQDLISAPGGVQHEAAIKEHGPVRKVIYDLEGAGRHRLTFTHADGGTSSSVHPQAYRAHSIVAQALGIDNPPAAVETHQRSRQYPIGPKENAEIRRHDHQEAEETA
jgi:hypothetical protein